MICYYCKCILTSDDLELSEEEPVSVRLLCPNCGNFWIFELEKDE